MKQITNDFDYMDLDVRLRFCVSRCYFVKMCSSGVHVKSREQEKGRSIETLRRTRILTGLKS